MPLPALAKPLSLIEQSIENHPRGSPTASESSQVVLRSIRLAMIFCPYCANLLVVADAGGVNKWTCKTCPYEYPIEKNYTERTHLTRKEVDDVLGGEDSWANVDSVATDCKKDCGSDRAFYMQLQIRSADEPSTTFYRCCNPKCAYQWRED